MFGVQVVEKLNFIKKAYQFNGKTILFGSFFISSILICALLLIHLPFQFILIKRELTEWFKVISLKLIWLYRVTSVRIGYFLYYIIRIRTWLVRYLIWVEDQLCSSHNNPKVLIYIYIGVYIIMLSNINVCIRYVNYNNYYIN